MSDNDTFDWDAYYRDTRKLSPEARGAWMDCLFHMRLEQTRGRISEPLSVYATMFGSTIEKAQRVINEIVERKVADSVTEISGNITLINRRMFRHWQQQDADKIRQRRYRGSPDPFVVTDLSQNGENRPLNKKNILKKEDKQKKISPTRLPDPFPLTDSMREWAVISCPGLKIEAAHENFVEYWTNNSTAKAKKLDWLLTWRKGMNLALKWQKENEARHQVGKSDLPEIVPDCSTCNDTGNVTQKPRTAKYDWEREFVPCPDCQKVEAVA